MSAKSTPPPKHPLRQLRDILGWSREKCAEETGLKAATIQNIERGAAPLPEDVAFAIEAATSCNAMELLQSSGVWRNMKTEHPANFVVGNLSSESLERLAPKTLGGSLFNKETYDFYRKSALSPEGVEKAIKDLSCRIDLLLGPLASKPEKFRRIYRYLAQVLNKEQRLSGPSDAEMAEYALGHGSSQLKVMTIGQISENEEVADSPAWKQIEAGGKFKPEQEAHVVIERFPFWPKMERAADNEHYLVPDYVFGERIVWRITLPDGKPLLITIDTSHATGLRGKLTEAMIKNNKDRTAGNAA